MAQGVGDLAGDFVTEYDGGVNTRGPITEVITLVTAFVIVLTFYAHTVFGLPSKIITPIVTILVTLTLATMAVLGAMTMGNVAAGTLARKISVALMFIAVWLSLLSTIAGAMDHKMSPNDWGVFVIQALTPIMLTLSYNRVALLRDMCRFAVLFALADFAVNLLAWAGIAHIAEVVGTPGSEYGVHYLGLPGSSFAEGIVAFLGISYVAAGIPDSQRWEFAGRVALVAVLFLSETMIRARADFGISVVAVLLLSFRESYRFPLVLVAAGVSAMLLTATFYANPFDSDERLRGDLIVEGFHSAQKHLILGAGIRYRDASDLVANYQSLHGAGVTESGAIDYAIAYGWIATVCLYLSSFFALSAMRVRQTLPAVLLACLTGALAITGALVPYFGSVSFYAALILCQREEWWLLQNRPGPL